MLAMFLIVFKKSGVFHLEVVLKKIKHEGSGLPLFLRPKFLVFQTSGSD